MYKYLISNVYSLFHQRSLILREVSLYEFLSNLHILGGQHCWALPGVLVYKYLCIFTTYWSSIVETLRVGGYLISILSSHFINGQP